MNPIRRPTFRSTFFISSAIVGILSLLQVIAAGGPSLFGKSVGGLAAGVMQYYPGIAVGEALKIHASVLLLVLIVVHYYRFAQRYLKFRGAAKALLFSSPLVGWALITLGSVTQYPALYESNLIARFSGLIFKSSYFLAPDLLRTLALLIALAPFIVVIAVRWRRRVLSGAGLSVAMCCLIFPLGGSAPSGAVPTIASQEAGDLDIILIGIDSLRSDRVGQGGPQGSNDRVAVMPTLTKLSQDMDSVSFEDHIVGIPRTFPSWIEILQGKYSAHTGIRHMFPGFSPRDSKFLGLTSRLKEAGYRTTVVSDFAGDIFPRFDAGFDEIVAPGMTLGNMIRQSVDLMFPLYLPLVTSYVGHSIFPALKTAAVYSDPSYLSDVSIKKMAANRSAYPGSPNFMTVFFSTAHFPYAAPYPYYRMFADKNYSGPFYFQKNPALNGDESGLSAEDKLQVAHLYDGSLRAVDDSLRVLLQRIRSTGR